MSHPRPVVLSFAGHDPSGGAGVQADIETISQHGCHSASVITCLTQQDSRDIYKITPQNPQDIYQQAQTILADCTVAVCKVGLLGNSEVAAVVADIVAQQTIPLVLDPILAAGGGANLADQNIILSIKNRLLPLATIATPNANEARILTGYQKLDDCAKVLLDKGCRYVLISTADDGNGEICNYLWGQDGTAKTYRWHRLPGQYHGSGCTLASAIAASMAQGASVGSAVLAGQKYTQRTLQNAYQIGGGQLNPNRLQGL